MNWEETVKFFEKGLPSSSTRWHKEVNIPAAKYRHVENTAHASQWEGVNIYQVGGDPSGEVRLYVIAHEEKKARKKTPDNAGGKSKSSGKKKTK